MSANEKASDTVLGLRAKDAPDAGGRVVMGSGRDLRGRAVVADLERQRVLFPPPSEATLEGIRELEADMRRDDVRLGMIRLD